MPKPRSEEEKKHGDKLGSLVGRTGGASSRDDKSGDEDPTQLQDDDDEDVQYDDAADRRDAGKRQQ
jgi:hypothetical protein